MVIIEKNSRQWHHEKLEKIYTRHTYKLRQRVTLYNCTKRNSKPKPFLLLNFSLNSHDLNLCICL